MISKKRKYISFFLLTVYTFLFVSVNFCYHSHQLSNTKIVHSHIWDGKAHSHTEVQFLNIDQLSTTLCEGATFVQLPQVFPVFIVEESVEWQGTAISSFVACAISLRAPPSFVA